MEEPFKKLSVLCELSSAGHSWGQLGDSVLRTGRRVFPRIAEALEPPLVARLPSVTAGRRYRVGLLFSSEMHDDALVDDLIELEVLARGGGHLHPECAFMLAKTYDQAELAADIDALAPPGASPIARAIVWHPYLEDVDGFPYRVGLDWSGFGTGSAGALYPYRHLLNYELKKDTGHMKILPNWPKRSACSETVFLVAV